MADSVGVVRLGIMSGAIARNLKVAAWRVPPARSEWRPLQFQPAP